MADGKNYNYNYNHNDSNICNNICELQHVIVGKDILIGNDLDLINKNDINHISSIKLNDKNFHRISYSLFSDIDIVLNHEPIHGGAIGNITKYQHEFK
jgi:hypothetical protein